MKLEMLDKGLWVQGKKAGMILGSRAWTAGKAFVPFPSQKSLRGLFRFQGIASFLEWVFSRLLEFRGKVGRKRHIQSLMASDSSL